jgi:1-acyl-sn-glycerol-3-phosphate acyltransferase
MSFIIEAVSDRPARALLHLARLFHRLYGAAATLVLVVVLLGLTRPIVIVAPTLGLRRRIGRAGVRLALASIGVPVHVRGLQTLPPGACIAVANHASYLDGAVLFSVLPSRFTFVVQDGAADWPVIGFVLRRVGVTFVNRTSMREGAVQTRALIQRVEAGESLGIFAEGTFVAEPGLRPFKMGAFQIAARAKARVVPIGIRGTRRLYGGHRRLPRWSRVEIDVLPALPVSDDAQLLRVSARAEVLRACGEGEASSRGARLAGAQA